jgi:hypothetical protein
VSLKITAQSVAAFPSDGHSEPKTKQPRLLRSAPELLRGRLMLSDLHRPAKLAIGGTAFLRCGGDLRGRLLSWRCARCGHPR